jgi:hypothetical protein
MGAILTVSPPHLRDAPFGALLRIARRITLLILAALAATGTPARAQTSASSTASRAFSPAATAGLHGVVTSMDGTAYEGAHVALELGGNGARQTLTTQTDSAGAFSFANLAPGAFKLTVTEQGFQTQTTTGVLQAGEDFDARDIALPMIGATDQVVVSAESRVEIAQQQLNLEEKQRVLGVFPNYYVTYDSDPEPLTSKQKFQLAWKTSIDPVTWALTGVIAGAEQAANIFPAYGQGMQGYGKRFGAAYTDDFTGDMIGGAILPSLFRQDPRYIYKGTGSVRSRAWYAIENAVICRGDNRRWQPNYSGILGSLAASGLSTLYYPADGHSALEITFSGAFFGTGETALQNLAQEFIVRKLTPRLPKASQQTTE